MGKSLQNENNLCLYVYVGKKECLKRVPIRGNQLLTGESEQITPMTELGFLASLILQIDPETVMSIVSEGESFSFVRHELTKTGLLRYYDGISEMESPEKTEEMIQRLIKLYPIFQLHQNAPYSMLVYETLGIAQLIERYRDFCTEVEKYPDTDRMRFFLFLTETGFFRDLPPDLMQNDLIHRGVLNHVERASVSDMMTVFREFMDAGKSQHEYQILCFEHILTATTYHVLSEGKAMKVCPNCGKSFVPTGRSDTLYCDNPSPQDRSMTCRQFKAQRSWLEKLKQDDLAALSRNIYSAKQMLMKRNPDNDGYREMFEYFKAERKQWIKAVADGTRSREEYAAWLNEMKGKRTLD